MAAPEFTDFDIRLGQSFGRLASSDAIEGSYWYALTDEEQGYVDITIGPPYPYIAISQVVDVTSLNAITLRVKWKASPDTNCRLDVDIAGTNVYTEDIPLGTEERGSYLITIPCAKQTGSQTIAVTAVYVS